MTNVTYTASGSGGASGYTAFGCGNITDLVNLPVDASITYIIHAVVPSAATDESLTNTATVLVPTTAFDADMNNNEATDTDQVRRVADLQITHTNGETILVAGSALCYTLTVTNAGPSDAVNATVSDIFPVALTNVTYTAIGSGASGYTPFGSGAIADLVTLPRGASITYTIHAMVLAAATGNAVTNTVTVSASPYAYDLNMDNNLSTNTDVLTRVTDLQITNTDGETIVVAGSALCYTLTMTNTGPSDAVGATVTDSDTGWSPGVRANTLILRISDSVGGGCGIYPDLLAESMLAMMAHRC